MVGDHRPEAGALTLISSTPVESPPSTTCRRLRFCHRPLPAFAEGVLALQDLKARRLNFRAALTNSPNFPARRPPVQNPICPAGIISRALYRRCNPLASLAEPTVLAALASSEFLNFGALT